MVRGSQALEITKDLAVRLVAGNEIVDHLESSVMSPGESSLLNSHWTAAIIIRTLLAVQID